jgi:hypothetical protein
MTLFSQRPKKSQTPQKSGEDFFGVQAKLSIGKSNDKYEVEADKMADTVVSNKQKNNTDAFFNPSPTVQRKLANDIQKQEENDIQEKPLAQKITPVVQLAAEKEETVQMRSNNDTKTASSSGIENKLNSSKNGGSPLQETTKTEMESGFGADFSKVRVHSDANAVQMNKELGSQAFANGNNVYFNEGKYNPNSQDGKHLLAHELTHTVQQGASKPAVQAKLTPEADKQNPVPTPKTETPIKAEAETKKAEAPKSTTENKTPNTVLNATPAAATQEEKLPENGNAAPNSEANVDPTNPATTAPNDAKTTQETPAVEEKIGEAGKETAKTAEIPTEDKKAEEGAIVEEPSIERDSKANPAFQATVAGIGKTAKQQKENDPAKQLSADAQAAAPSPSNERNSQAQANQVDEMEAQEPQVFSAEAFKAQLMSRIAEMQLPKNNEEADEFEDNNNIDEVNKKATGDVQKEKATAAGPIDQTTNKEPNTSAVPERKEVALPPLKQAPKPKSVGATKAIPDTRPESEVTKPIQEDTARMDQTMAENKVTDEQLEKSEEPSFQEALGKKKEAKTTAEVAPMSLREQENAVLQKNASGAENTSQKELEGMNLLRGTALQGVGTTQAGSSSKDTSERQRIADEINVIYEETKTDVTNILDTLETTVTQKFEAEAETAKGKFEDYVDKKMSAYKARRYGGIGGGLKWGYDLFAGLPDEVNVFFTEGREVFVKHMDGAIDVIANIVANELTRAKNRIEIGKQKVTDYVNELPANQKKFGEEAANDIQDKFDSLKQDVNSKQESLVDSLAQQYSDSIAEVDARIEEMKAANKGLIDAALGFINGIIETIKKLRELVSSLLSAIASVIEVIIAAPIEFMGNLFKGIGQGIDLFKANIQKHLLSGLLEWLTGSLGPMGITLPDDIFSLSGIFNLLMQVLGLGWDYLRMKAVKMMGEPVVNALTAGYDMFIAFSTKGIDGIWEYLQESFSDLKETVIDAIKNMLITQVIEAGIKWLLSLLIPGAGFIKAIMAIKDVVVFFVESAIMLIPALIEGILALAAGSVAGVAKAIEFGLAKLLPLVIGLFAKLIGLGGLSKKVMKIFTNIRKRVDKAVNKLLMKAKAAGRKILAKLGIGKNQDGSAKPEKSGGDGELGKTIKFSDGEENHKLWIDESSGHGVLKVASTPKTVEDKIIEWETKLAGKEWKDGRKADKKARIIGLIANVKGQLKTIEQGINQADTAESSGQPVPENVDNGIEQNEVSMSENLKQIFMEFDEAPDFKVLFAEDLMQTHTAAKTTVDKSVDIISSTTNDFKEIQSFNGLTQKLKSTNDTDKLFNDPIKNGEPYEEYVRNQIDTVGAEEDVKDNYNNKKDTILSKMTSGTDVHNALKKQILDKSHESTSNKKIKQAIIASADEHNKYKPQNITPSIKNDQFFLNFDYGEDAERLGGKRDFMVRLNLIDAQSGIVDQSTTGRNLTLKEEGTRGRTASAGEIAEAGFSDLNSAHILADWFEGSGYKSSLNLIATSAHYNQEIMGRAEKLIADQITDFTNNNSTLHEISTHIQVDARWQAMSQDKVIDTLKAIQSTKGMSPDEIQELANETYRKLQGIQFPRKCLKVIYRAKMVVNGKATSMVFFKEIGADDWLNL